MARHFIVTGGVWVASYVLLWFAVLALSIVVVALLRQVGVLHTRLRPLGVHPGNEGPEVGSVAAPVPDVDFRATELTLLAFTSPTCTICRELQPSLDAMQDQYDDIRVVEVSLGSTTQRVFSAFDVRSTPYFVAVGADGVVRGAGVANSLEQVEVLVDQALTSA